MRFAVCMVKRILLAALVAILLLTGATGGRLLSAALADETPTNGMVRVFLSSLGGGIKQVEIVLDAQSLEPGAGGGV